MGAYFEGVGRAAQAAAAAWPGIGPNMSAGLTPYMRYILGMEQLIKPSAPGAARGAPANPNPVAAGRGMTPSPGQGMTPPPGPGQGMAPRPPGPGQGLVPSTPRPLGVDAAPRGGPRPLGRAGWALGGPVAAGIAGMTPTTMGNGEALPEQVVDMSPEDEAELRARYEAMPTANGMHGEIDEIDRNGPFDYNAEMEFLEATNPPPPPKKKKSKKRAAPKKAAPKKAAPVVTRDKIRAAYYGDGPYYDDTLNPTDNFRAGLDAFGQAPRPFRRR